MGFYPVTGQDIYLIGSPLSSSVRSALEKKRIFTITTRGLSPENRYVQSALLNGRDWDQAWIRHGDIAKGGALTLVMGPRPSDWGTRLLPLSDELMPPPSVALFIGK